MENLFGRFKVLRLLHRNQEGRTVLVNDVEWNTDLILKVLRKGKFDFDRFALSRFYAWSQTIRHQSLGNLVAAGLGARGELYWARTYYSTQNETRTANDYIRSLVTAIGFLHSHGYLHCRIRPSNLLELRGQLQLVDARPWSKEPGISNSIDIHFTAPEVLRGGKPTIASDLYSLGATLYFLLVGRTLFDDVDLEALRSKYLLARPEPLRSLRIVEDR